MLEYLKPNSNRFSIYVWQSSGIGGKGILKSLKKTTNYIFTLMGCSHISRPTFTAHTDLNLVFLRSFHQGLSLKNFTGQKRGVHP